jgi:hypothetical protein
MKKQFSLITVDESNIFTFDCDGIEFHFSKVEHLLSIECMNYLKIDNFLIVVFHKNFNLNNFINQLREKTDGFQFFPDDNILYDYKIINIYSNKFCAGKYL